MTALAFQSRSETEPRIVLSVAGPSGRFLPAVFSIDTGSSHTLVDDSLASALGYDVEKAAKTPYLTTPAGSVLHYAPCLLHLGATPFFVSIMGGFARLNANILGRDFLHHFHFAWYRQTIWLSIGS